MDDEYKLLSQKAMINWLKDGDKNTAFFHKVVKGRKHRSRIESICDDNGVRYFRDDVPGQFVKHFQNFLGTERKEITNEEIKEALDVCLAVKEFFQTRKLLKEMNATVISLIPKLSTPNKVSDFRPIACCNVLYKCINKVITNRIKSGLEKVVSINQSAFIPAKNIQDNILLTHELLKGYNMKNGPKRCALKIDLQKAYDTMSWSFLKTVLKRFGFHEVMGDHISPYLFTFVMKVLNLIMIKNIKADGRFRYHAGCKDLQLTHLCFADDLMVFCNGDVHSISIMKKFLNEFRNVSVLLPNIKKSTIFFRSINDQVKKEIINIVALSIGKLPMKYLGVSLLAKCLCVKDCSQLIDKVMKTFLWSHGGSNGWKLR
ncbi:RNA-directed DNA polymerase, eukaryota, reverse transcriptase zinc-binding domain protein [Tanacetum coccineum]|uniref:RNA-directed DNA polymerase, eukaryota, reverse transcriptase zinc-binding domain protein n=1 Tax=Tanacetum coccineum TaxID=301880 RepID=A0ABQ5H8E3_9ASTR